MRYIIIFLVLLTSTAQANVFVYCSEGSPTAFNPQVTTDGTSNNASGHPLYNRLVKFRYGSTEVIPDLASKYDVSKDGLTYTFYLRKDVVFHTTPYFTPSRNFNADDVLFSFQRQMDENHPYHKIGGGSYEYFSGMGMDKLIQKVEKIDDYTVKFHLSHPEAPFLANLAMTFASILSKEYADQLVKQSKMADIDHKPIGTGPFIFHKYVKDTLIRFKRNDLFYGEKPDIERLIFNITPDPTIRYQKLKTGECHFIAEPSPQDIKSMKQNPDIQVMEEAGLNVGYLAMNTQKAPLNQLKVRKAISHALNREAYIEAIYMGNAQVAKSPLPPSIWGYDPNLKTIEYNPKIAQKLLKEAKVKTPLKLKLWTLPISRPYNPNGKKMGEMMQADLKKIGIEVELVTYDWPTYLARARKGEHDLIQLGWTGDNGDPDNFLNVLLGCQSVGAGSNTARWCHKEFNQLLQKARQITDRSERTKLYHRALAIYKRESPWVSLAHATVFRAMHKSIQNYKIDPFGSDNFQYIKFKK